MRTGLVSQEGPWRSHEVTVWLANWEDSCESQQVRTGLVNQEGPWRSHQVTVWLANREDSCESQQVIQTSSSETEGRGLAS